MTSLGKVAGVYGLVVPCEDVQFPGAVVGHFTGGEPLRAVLPKVLRGGDTEQTSDGGVDGTYTRYGMQLIYDVPLGQYNGVLCVRVCWHDIVYCAEFNFAQKAFAF